jgi:hypothetical protein
VGQSQLVTPSENHFLCSVVLDSVEVNSITKFTSFHSIMHFMS